MWRVSVGSLSPVSNSVGAKSEMVETLSVGEGGAENRASISVSEDNSISRNIGRNLILCEAEVEPLTPVGAVGMEGTGVSDSPWTGTSAAVIVFLSSSSFLCCNHLSWIS